MIVYKQRRPHFEIRSDRGGEPDRLEQSRGKGVENQLTVGVVVDKDRDRLVTPDLSSEPR